MALRSVKSVCCLASLRPPRRGPRHRCCATTVTVRAVRRGGRATPAAGDPPRDTRIGDRTDGHWPSTRVRTQEGHPASRRFQATVDGGPLPSHSSPTVRFASVAETTRPARDIRESYCRTDLRPGGSRSRRRLGPTAGCGGSLVRRYTVPSRVTRHTVTRFPCPGSAPTGTRERGGDRLPQLPAVANARPNATSTEVKVVEFVVAAT